MKRLLKKGGSKEPGWVINNMKGLLHRIPKLNLYHLLIIVVLVAALIVGSYYLANERLIRSKLELEGAKYLLQLIIVVVIGGILVQLYSQKRDRAQAEADRRRDRAQAKADRDRDEAQAEADRNRDRAQAENEFRKDLLASLTRAYNDTKKIRRILKASTVLMEKGPGETEDRYEIEHRVYEQQMQNLMDPQLEFEFYAKQLKVTGNLFNDTKKIKARLDALEEYLNEIIDEYDNKKGAYKTKKPTYPSSIPTDKLEMLDNFLSGTGFKKNFVYKFDLVAQDIQKEILEVRP